MKSKKINLITFLLLIIPMWIMLQGVSCENNTTDKSVSACGVENPLLDLPWLIQLKNNLEENAEVTSAEIDLYKFNSADYFYVIVHYQSTYDTPNSIYNCEGSEQYKCGGNQPTDNCSDFFNDAQKITTLWKK